MKNLLILVICAVPFAYLLHWLFPSNPALRGVLSLMFGFWMGYEGIDYIKTKVKGKK